MTKLETLMEGEKHTFITGAENPRLDGVLKVRKKLGSLGVSLDSG